MKKYALRSLLAIATAAATFGATAAQNPDAATANDSSGNFIITMNLAPYIIVNQFDDLELTVDPANGASGKEDICVGGYGFPDYSIAFSSGNGTPEMPFALKGATDSVPYAVQFANNITDETGADVLDDGTLGADIRHNRNATVSDCLTDGEENASIFIAVDADDWQNTSEQSFSDTLTVTVSAI
ncbi:MULTISPECIES: hypothetical protein [Microbulbifer]|uniref:Secreted protein n=1 Tax=Microbulbifer celer TaxID=435905 RepID=A0ABW3U4W5_9GAMM|nr:MULTISPECIES: hypothetical protein [Microbulbifer]UFN57856.1 hypothetical protein LPW13_02075 [Microbulbifer celer]